MTGWRLVCDVGGTNIRIGRSEGPKQIENVIVHQTRRCSSLLDDLLGYCRTFDDYDQCQGLAVAAAGPVDTGRVTLTNGYLTIDQAELTAGLNGRPVALFNDLEAAAYSVPLLGDSDLNPIVRTSSRSSKPFLVINVGTGFGAALLLQTPSGWQSVATEAGHTSLAAFDRDGRPAMNSVMCVENKISGLALPPGQPFASSQFASEFGELLGWTCGNLVLATGAWGGVYFCGTVASAWIQAGNLSSFTAAFQNKGRMSERMARVPVSEILLPHPALIGLSAVKLR